MHHQASPSAEAKLFECIMGAIDDVSIDLRFCHLQAFGQGTSASSRSGIGALQILFREERLNIVEIANLKQVSGDTVRQTGTALRPDDNVEDQVTGEGTMPRREGDADITPSQQRGLVGALRRLWEGWKRVARKIGDFQARALMTLFYFIILAPVSMGLRWGSDPLAIKSKTPRGWKAMEKREGTPIEHARRQY